MRNTIFLSQTPVMQKTETMWQTIFIFLFIFCQKCIFLTGDVMKFISFSCGHILTTQLLTFFNNDSVKIIIYKSNFKHKMIIFITKEWVISG